MVSIVSHRGVVALAVVWEGLMCAALYTAVCVCGSLWGIVQYSMSLSASQTLHVPLVMCGYKPVLFRKKQTN